MSSSRLSRFERSRSRSTARALLVATAVMGAGSSALVVACGDDGSSPRAFDESVDGSVADRQAPTEAATPTDAGVQPDVRGPYDPTTAAVSCDASPCVTQIVAGSDHFCARMNDGTVRCWGANNYGVLGTVDPDPDPGGGIGIGGGGVGIQSDDAGADGGDDAGSTVRVIGNLTNVTQLSAAGSTTCARLEDGTVACWGANTSAQLGLDATTAEVDYDPHPSPSPVALSEPATRVDVGQGSACAMLASGKTWCWGRDEHAQLLRAGDEPIADPWRYHGPGAAETGSLTFTGLAIGDNNTLGLSNEGEVWTWGAIGGDNGTIAGRVGSVSPLTSPKRIESLHKVTSLVASVWLLVYGSPPRAHACALADGEVYCWGRSYGGALCTGVPSEEREPTHAPFASSEKAWPQQLSAGDEITCARMTDGSVHCCGTDTRGRLGTGASVITSARFTKASAFTNFAVQVATTDRAVCALVQDGTVECWGSNEKGELGRLRDDADHFSPVKVAF
ncbi:hypothetical protein AKJ09_07767 [Labilithrix luteola]|uniref:BNR repeat domain protein n=1 Tax=Labilithrix luteola TaxID=1391654 RepID=A0A0K1Q5U7_9BACT|nr:RCC1 domain-containing protein [Labilithrix luteola]AKV01104.1 hypothetical protein AKJ09_07767 [Labilithrix luteola]